MPQPPQDRDRRQRLLADALAQATHALKTRAVRFDRARCPHLAERDRRAADALDVLRRSMLATTRR